MTDRPILKNSVFWVGHFEFFFASSPWKLVTNYVLEWMGLNFYYYDGLQPKMSAGIINEHECIWYFDRLVYTYAFSSKVRRKKDVILLSMYIEKPSEKSWKISLSIWYFDRLVHIRSFRRKWDAKRCDTFVKKFVQILIEKLCANEVKCINHQCVLLLL